MWLRLLFVVTTLCGPPAVRCQTGDLMEQTTTADYNIRKPPEIFNPPVDHTLEIFHGNLPLTVPCNATGDTPITYLWRWNGEDIKAGNAEVTFDPKTGVLSFPKGVAIGREEGDFRCLATNKHGTSMSQIVRIKAKVEGQFNDSETLKVEVTEHKGVAVPCRGKPTFVPEGFYHWYLLPQESTDKSNQLQHDEKLSVDANGTLFITNAYTELNKINIVYACAVQTLDKSTIKTGGRVSIRVTQSVAGAIETPPKLLGSTGKITVNVGQEALLECFFSGHPVPIITWKDSRDREITANDPRYHLIPNEFNRKLKFIAREDDEGNFRCEARNMMGTDQSTIFLNVTSRPIFDQSPENVITPRGSDATFTCKARPAVRETPLSPPEWLVNANTLETVSKIAGRYSLSADKTQLTFHYVTDDDSMCVQCSVSNERGNTFGEATLTVIDPLTIVRRPGDIVEAERNQTFVELSITAEGDMCCELQFDWYLGDEPLERTALQRHPYSYWQDGNSVTLTISLEGSKEDVDKVLGVYRCYVWSTIYLHNNKNHNQNVTVQLKMKAEEPTVPPVAEPQQAASASLWWLGILFGVIVLIAAGIFIFVMIHYNYPRQEYLLEKEEIRHKLNPEKDLLDQSFVEI